VYAAEHLQFKSFNGAEVDVRGCANETTQAKQDKWIKEYSDTLSLIFGSAEGMMRIRIM